MTNLIHFFSRCTTSLGEFNITNEATALKLMRKASKFAKDVFVNFLLFNNNEHIIKKQRHTLNIHTVCIQLKLFEAGSAGTVHT